MRWFRVACGVVLLLIALIFLSANTVILGRYGWRSGTDELESLINMTVAGTVPLALAVMPFLVMGTWTQGRWIERRGRQRWRRGRPSGITVAAIALYGVFVSFNFFGAIGSIALQRTEYVDKREGAIDETARLREARARKAAELAKLQVDRPPAAVQADLDGARIHRFWGATSECTDATSRAHSKFCGSVASWKRELGMASEAAKLRADVDDLDRRLSSDRAAIAHADPKSETIAHYASMLLGPVTPKAVRMAEPLLWFTLLELTSMMMLWGSLKLFGLGHEELMADVHPIEPNRRLPPPRPLRAEPVALQTVPVETVVEVPGALGGEDAELQAAICERFWAESTRHAPGSRVSLADLQVAYRAYSAARGVQPYPSAEFKRRASGRQTSTIGDTTWVLGIVLAEPMGAV